MTRLKLRSIRQLPWLMTMDGTQDNPVGLIEDAAVLVEGGMISWVGKEKDCPEPPGQGIDIEGAGLVVMPGLIDCHTHLVFAGDRVQDFYDRARGASYSQIMERGGGILQTVELTRFASKVELVDRAMVELRKTQARGVTTMEVKSGYGLNLTDEIKILEVIKALNELQPVTLIPTFMGAHTVPAEYRDKPSFYVDSLINDVLPAVAEKKLAAAVDVFVENGAFSIDDALKIMSTASRLGFKLKIHADQLSASGAAGLAADIGCLSVSHLEHSSPQDLQALARAKVVAEILPVSETYLGFTKVADVRQMIDLGVKVAIATDFNPGSSMCSDLQLAMRLAIVQRKMTVEEALLGISHHAACALGEQSQIGQIKVGMKADLCVFEGSSPWSMAYDWTGNPVLQVIKNGEIL